MISTLRTHCRTALRQSIRALRANERRRLSSSSSSPTKLTPTSLSAILSKPTWSVRSLLPSHSSRDTISPQTLHHLLRLSALPPPHSADEESRMLSTLQSQLHFVRAVQDVDTTGVEPLRSVRDETAAGLQEQTVGLDQLRDTLAREDVVGHARRPRRRRQQEGQEEVGPNGNEEDWDVFGGASEIAGRYFVVRTGPSGSV